MMREIIFRAWWKDDNTLVDPESYVIRPDGTIEFPEGGWDLQGRDSSDLVILEQFTGIYDSTTWKELAEKERDEWVQSGRMSNEWKGKMIFEGDVVFAGYGEYYQCTHEYSTTITVDMSNYDALNALCNANVVEVIGNIHEEEGVC